MPGPGGTDSNSDPVVTTDAPAMLAVMEEVSADWDVSAWFSDPDAGDTLTYTGTLQKTDEDTATALPDWLVLDGATGELTIATAATDDAQVGFYTLLVTATDDSDAMASVTHTVILAIEDDPTDGTVTDAGEPPIYRPERFEFVPGDDDGRPPRRWRL